MSKIITMTEQEIERIKEEFAEALRGMKLSDGKITYSKDFGKVERKADLFYSEVAWMKQNMLISEFDKEVAWHGIARRGDDPEVDEYIIEDIIVYPQEVTGATVTTDQEKYQNWLYSQPDEVFNNIRMQGHSHVNMGTSPSSVDLSLYERILGQMGKNMFYIFLIWNKRGEYTAKIYDMEKNILFETTDVTISILDEGAGFDKFIADAKEMVKTRAYTSSSYYNKEKDKKDDAVKVAATSGKADTNSGGEKKGKKKGRKATGNAPKNQHTSSYYDGYWYDDYYRHGY